MAASPWRNNEVASIPLSDVDVIFSLNTTGPSNSETNVELSPPSTLRDLLTEISSGEITSNPTLNAPVSISSPVTVGTGVSKTSSLPVAELTFLLPV